MFITNLYYRLCNSSEPKHSLILTRLAWHQMLELAEFYGWIPMGTTTPGLLAGVQSSWDDGSRGVYEREGGSYTPGVARFVMLEDALNLADALERAFIGYDPQPEPAWSYYEGEWNGTYHSSPGVGVILTLADFCRMGEFWIERR